MNVEWLQTYLIVVETGSYTSAADRLLISQPAVSKQIRHLEAYFGAELIYWSGRQLYLTNAGKSLHQVASRILSELEDARVTMRGMPNQENTVTIATGPTLAFHYVPFLVSAADEATPIIRISTHMAIDQDELIRVILEGKADIALHTGMYSDSSLMSQQIAIDDIVLAAHPSHPLASLQSVGPHQLGRYRIFMLKSNAESRRLVDDWLVGNRLNQTLITEVNSHEEVRAMLLANCEMGFVSRIAIERDLLQGLVAEVMLSGFQVSRFLYASTRRDATPVTRRLLEIMGTAFKAMNSTRTVE